MSDRNAGIGEVVFHLPLSVLRGDEPLKPFYLKVFTGLAERGIRVRQVRHDRATILAEVAADDAMHIADHGTSRHPRLLNAGIAYVYPFWNLDPWGIRALSSIAAETFDPKSVPPEAPAWVDRHRRRLIDRRQSRYPQPAGTQVLPDGAVAVFLQSESHRAVEETSHLTQDQLIDALLARDDPSPILVKLHPLERDAALRDRLMRRQDTRLRIVDANIHDMLAVASVAVTINSAVGIEAMFHGRPVVLCGQSDFHHAAVTVRHPDEMDAAIARARATDWPHDAFLYWYFAQHCLNAGSDRLVEDFLARVAAVTPRSAPVRR